MIIQEARDILASDALVSAKEYRRIIEGLINEVYAAYEAGGAFAMKIEGKEIFTYDELMIARRLG